MSVRVCCLPVFLTFAQADRQTKDARKRPMTVKGRCLFCRAARVSGVRRGVCRESPHWESSERRATIRQGFQSKTERGGGLSLKSRGRAHDAARARVLGRGIRTVRKNKRNTNLSNQHYQKETQIVDGS